MFGREVVERQQRFAILRQAFDRLVVLRPVFLGEDIDRHLGLSPVRRQVNLAQVLLHVRLHRQRDLVQHVRRLMHPTPLVPCSWKYLVDRLPEAERTVADGNFRGDLQPPLLHFDQELTPALRTLPSTNPEADEFLLAFRRRADQHQHAFGIVFHPSLQVDPVRPDIHVSPRRRQVRRILAQKRRQRLLEITSRDAAQVKDWQQRIQALRPPSPSRQDRRGKADTVACAGSPAIPDLYPADLDWPDPRLDRAFGTMTMSDKTVATVGQLEILHGGQKHLGLHLDSLR